MIVGIKEESKKEQIIYIVDNYVIIYKLFLKDKTNVIVEKDGHTQYFGT